MLDSFGDDGDGFFADESRTQVNSQQQVLTTFASLSVSQQAELRLACSEAAAGSSGGGGLCAAIDQLPVQ